MVELTLNVIGAGAVLYAAFCRLVHTNRRTRAAVRLAVLAVAAVAVAALVGPLVSAWRPDMLHAATLCAVALHLAVSARVWRHGVPSSFQI